VTAEVAEIVGVDDAILEDVPALASIPDSVGECADSPEVRLTRAGIRDGGAVVSAGWSIRRRQGHRADVDGDAGRLRYFGGIRREPLIFTDGATAGATIRNSVIRAR
jgi:hypothetical protein